MNGEGSVPVVESIQPEPKQQKDNRVLPGVIGYGVPPMQSFWLEVPLTRAGPTTP